MVAYLAEITKGVYPRGADLEKVAADILSPVRTTEGLGLLETLSGRPFEAGQTLLEIGAGFGLLVSEARVRFGLRAFGIEPDERCRMLAREVLHANGETPLAVVASEGEMLPFPSCSFDWVYSTNALEHVRSPLQVLQEAARVLRPGGTMQFVVPNYGSFWEGHFGIPWVPRMPRSAARSWARLFGRDARYVDTLQLLDAGTLRGWVQGMPSLILLDDGFSTFERRLTSGLFSAWALMGRLRPWVSLIRTLRLTGWVLRLARWFDWHTPVILTARRTR